MSVKMWKAHARYSAPHRKPECVKWEGGVEGLFFRRAGEGVCVLEGGGGGGVTDRRRPGMWPNTGAETPALHEEESGKRQTQLKSRKK